VPPKILERIRPGAIELLQLRILTRIVALDATLSAVSERWTSAARLDDA
jgi:hypothetical protein